MGCAPLKKQAPFVRKESPVGLLRITIIGVHIHEDIKIKDPNLRLRVSNQYFITKNVPLIDEK